MIYNRAYLVSTVAFLSLFTCLFLAFPVHAGNPDANYDVLADEESGETFFIQRSDWFHKLKKPAVGVALGGGGARALVNVGILKALEEEAIPVDLVVGSSMGAIMAALYGSGMPLSEIEALVTSDILPSMFDLNFPFIYSVIDTRRVNYFIERVSPQQRLEDFPICTALLSYDLTNGVKYVHTTGRVSREIQGSYSIPLFFPVVKYDGLFLMDPGILELTPAQTARVLGADVVISTTAFDALPYDTYDLPVRAWTRFINLLKERNSQEIIDRYSDITINCLVGDYSFMDYHLAAEFIALGYREAKKLIPQIKQVLEHKNIPLKTNRNESTVKEDHDYSNLKRVVSKVKDRRLLYDFTQLKPLVYFGREHSIFRQTLLREEATILQYGLLFQKGNIETKVLTRGKDFDYFEAQLRLIQLTPGLDLVGKVRLQEDDVDHNTTSNDSTRQDNAPDYSPDYAVDLKYYHPSFTACVGWAEIEGQEYLHHGGTYNLTWVPANLQGEVDLYLPLSPRQAEAETETKYIYSQLIDIGLGKYFTLRPKMIISNTKENQAFSHHLLYRGIKPEESSEERRVQATLELDYTYAFPYSIEFFQCMQVKEVTWYQFVDTYYTGDDYTQSAYAVGSGVDCELNLLGIKPFSFGGYVAYDLDEEAWRSALSLNLVF